MLAFFSLGSRPSPREKLKVKEKQGRPGSKHHVTYMKVGIDVRCRDYICHVMFQPRPSRLFPSILRVRKWGRPETEARLS